MIMHSPEVELSPIPSLSPLQPELESHFNLNPNKPVTDALHDLPFVHASQLQRQVSKPTISLGIQQIPVERIVCSPRDMNSWAAVGSIKCMPDGTTQPTLERAMSMAHARAYESGPADMSVHLFRDAAGEIWGRAVNGSHRTLAAKINSEPFIRAEVLTSEDSENMDYFPRDVVALALEDPPIRALSPDERRRHDKIARRHAASAPLARLMLANRLRKSQSRADATARRFGQA